MKDIYIFGASGTGIATAQMLDSMGICWNGFLDNDKNKWGAELHKKKVYSPEETLKEDCEVIIASDYYEEIEPQLLKLTFPLSQVHCREWYITQHMKQNWNLGAAAETKLVPKEKPLYIVDLAEGFRLGGIETWSYVVAKALREAGEKCLIYGKEACGSIPEEQKKYVKLFSFSYEKTKENVEELIQDLANQLPCVVITSWYSQLFFAANFLKQRYGSAVKIIGVVHHDMLRYYRRNQEMQSELDAFLCVSQTVQKRMAAEFGIQPRKAVYCPVPVYVEIDKGRFYSDESQPLRIGFGARLVKFQKRADRIPSLLDQLERNKINYFMEIAGDGPYYDELQRFIEKAGLSNKVLMAGKLSQKEMPAFWERQDIVLGLSDSEGIGLSILEAMGQGAVPIVTKTAGIEEFVIENETGFLCPVDDISEMWKLVQYFELNRDKLKNMGQKASDQIKKLCSPAQYVRQILEIVQSECGN